MFLYVYRRTTNDNDDDDDDDETAYTRVGVQFLSAIATITSERRDTNE